MVSEKPKTQRLPKKKQQEEAIKQAKLKQLTKPQPAPEKPRTVAKTTAPMKKRMKPIRGPMVEANRHLSLWQVIEEQMYLLNQLQVE